MNIVPMRDLKDTVKIEALCNESNVPVFVTKNGYGKLVVMNMKCYEELISGIKETKIINDRLMDLENGKTIDGNKVLDSLRDKYGF